MKRSIQRGLEWLLDWYGGIPCIIASSAIGWIIGFYFLNPLLKVSP